jgi:hypothetical protein
LERLKRAQVPVVLAMRRPMGVARVKSSRKIRGEAARMRSARQFRQSRSTAQRNNGGLL